MFDLDKFGYLVWYSIPDVSAPYDALLALAQATGYPADCVPSKPKARHCWEKATATGERGIDVTPPQHISDQVERDYGVKPQVRLKTRRIDSSAPRLIRHFVREAVISAADRPEKQLDMGTVAVMEFNTETGTARSTVLHDDAGYANGDVARVLSDMDAKMAAQMDRADGGEIRYGIRELLSQQYRVCLRGTGGVYFVPAAVGGAEQALRAARAFVGGLDQYKTGDLEPNFQVVTLAGENAEEIRDDVVRSVVSEFRGRLQKMGENLKPVLEGRAKGKLAARVARNAFQNWLEIQAGLKAYRETLEDDLGQLDTMLKLAQAAVMKANRME